MVLFRRALDKLSSLCVIVSYRWANTQRLVFPSSLVFSCKGYKAVKIGKKQSGRRVQLHKAACICILKNNFSCLIVFHTMSKKGIFLLSHLI